MTKILAKIARRHGGNELPDRRELVEMDLFDTDRNPWSPKGGEGDEFWIRNDYDFAVPTELPYWNPFGPTPPFVGPVDLVVERPSLALLFVGGTFDAVSGVGLAWTNYVHLQLNISEATEDPFVFAAVRGSTGSDPHANYSLVPYDSAYEWTVLHPGTYKVNVLAYVTDLANSNDGSYGHPVVNMTLCAATVALLPADIVISGWGGVLG